MEEHQLDPAMRNAVYTSALLLYGGYGCGSIGLFGVLALSGDLATGSGDRNRAIPILFILSSLITIRMARAFVHPVARGIAMSWRATSVFVSAVLTMTASFLPALRERVFELICSLTMDVVAKWLMMIVIAKSKRIPTSDSWTSWRLAKQIHESGAFDLVIDGGSDAYVASLLSDYRECQSLLYLIYCSKAVKNAFLTYAACSEIGKFDNENAAQEQISPD